MSRCPSLVLSTLVASLATAPARADEIIFRVPVEVRSLMPEVKKVAALCEALNGAGQQILVNGIPVTMKSTNKVDVDASGSFSGTLEAKETVAPGIGAQVASYRCFLTLIDGSGATIDQDLSSGPTPTDLNKPKPGAPFVPKVTGSFPPAAVSAGS